MKIKTIVLSLLFCSSAIAQDQLTYPIVDTGVTQFYNNNEIVSEQLEGMPFYGQDAHYSGATPSYTDNGNGTITDNITGLMWLREMGSKMTFDEAFVVADSLTFTGSNANNESEDGWVRYIDTNYFNQPFGDLNVGERVIDAQTWSSTEYTGRTMNNDETVFGVNFVDGRIKGYPKYKPGGSNTPNKMYFRFVRGNPEYGSNNYIDNGNGTITDLATGLMWQQADDGVGRNWKDALLYSSELDLVGYSDWRLPNTKELHSIVDYTRLPQTTQSAAISPLFSVTEINDPEGNPGQYPYFWTSTAHIDGVENYTAAVYIAFGEAQGKMNNVLLDVHGAGAQRSDPKNGNIVDYPSFFGPQGDVRYVFNYVRSVRTIDTNTSIKNEEAAFPTGYRLEQNYPNPFNPVTTIRFSIPNSADINLSVFDVTGQLVRKLMEGSIGPGERSILWDGLNDRGVSVSSGLYFYVLRARDHTLSRKLLTLK